MQLLPILPDEIWLLIYCHRAATVIQNKWLRFSLFAHSRKAHWTTIRCHLKEKGAWPSLMKYELVRREWRVEAESWRNTHDINSILKEATDGLWGFESTRLTQISGFHPLDGSFSFL